MKKFANYPIDVTDMIIEGNIEYLSKITNGIEEQIKEAHVPSLEELIERPNEDFALILYHPHLGEMKKLATYDKPLTEINTKIFLDKVSELPDEIAKVAGHYLYKAAKYFKLKIPAELAKFASANVKSNRVDVTEINELQYVSKVAKAGKPQTKTSSFALPKQNKYPLDDANLIKAAVAYFDRYCNQFTPSQRLEYAGNVKTAADKFSINISSTNIEKYAQLDAAHFADDFARHISIRQSYVGDTYKLAYAELLEKSAELGVAKTATVLERLDKKANINRLWDTCIADPASAVYGFETPKFIKVAGMNVTANDLKKIAEHPDAEKYIDSQTKAALTSDEGLDIFESLPSPIKDQLISLK